MGAARGALLIEDPIPHQPKPQSLERSYIFDVALLVPSM